MVYKVGGGMLRVRIQRREKRTEVGSGNSAKMDKRIISSQSYGTVKPEQVYSKGLPVFATKKVSTCHHVQLVIQSSRDKRKQESKQIAL